MSQRRKYFYYCFSLGGAFTLISFYLGLFFPETIGLLFVALSELLFFRVLGSLLVLLCLLGFGRIFFRALLTPLETSVLTIQDEGGDITIAVSALESHIEMTALREAEVKKAKAELKLSGAKNTRIELALSLWLNSYAEAQALSERLSKTLTESIRAFSGQVPDIIRFRYPELESKD